MFCSLFDDALAAAGPAAVFLPDTEGKLRFHASWTRDCWGRANGPHAHVWSWHLFRDQGTGYVQLALVTSDTLIPEHPRLDIRTFATRGEAEEVRASFGNPPIATEPW